MTKRPDGALEHEIMTVLWHADRPLQPGEVKPLLQAHLAYTSVATVLGRLHTKGLVERVEAGRAFAYRASIDESQLAVRRISDVLSSTSDKRKVLAGFVGSLSKKDAKALRTMLEIGEP
ncbi:MAG: BlaI/MecI/CopY family transcriptional regulator [Actinomycetota bacterium]|nr:MAG: putative transcriptional regulator [Acidimicrobiaceae bacterium]